MLPMLFPWIFLALAFATGSRGATEVVFNDSFESAPSSCTAGTAPDNALAGRLGPAPTAAFESLGCFEIRNDAPVARVGEIASGGLAIPRATGLHESQFQRLVVVAPGDARVVAQFRVVSRWGGPLIEDTRPVRWLEVVVPASLTAGGTAAYELRRYPAPVAPVAAIDPFALTTTAAGGAFDVDTGLATLRLNPDNPAVFDFIDVDPDNDGTGPRTRAVAHAPGAGPRLTLPGTPPVTLSTAEPGEVVVETFRFAETGPVRARAVVTGRFVDPSGVSVCTDAGVAAYPPFGFTLTVDLYRASRDVEFEWIVRNECSDAFFPPWTDQVRTVERIEWRLPLAPGGGQPMFAAGGGVVVPAGSSQVVVEQRKGAFAGGGWSRRAEARADASVVEAVAAFDAPLAATASGTVVATVQMPWMRYREPQALVARGDALSFRPVSRPLVLGEGKGLWARALIRFRPAGGDAAATAAAMRTNGRLRLESPLLPRWRLGEFNAAGVLPRLAAGTGSAVETAWRNYVTSRHDNTVRDDAAGQWARFATYGSQLWPDTQANDLFAFPDPATQSPATNSGAMNYWNPSGAELMEFLRTGETRWVWDFAQPQAWLQLFTARMNIGARGHGARNGVAVTSGGTGEGQWHRSGGGSDDYTYNAGMHLHYALRPTPAMRARFRHGGRMIVNRYAVPWNPGDPGDTTDPARLATQTDRDVFFNAVMPVRGNVQHYELLANCAAFVPGADGAACDARLHEILAELATDNLRAGLLCRDDVPVDEFCDLPQTFMTNAMMYRFLLRYYLNYGDVADAAGQPALSRTLGRLMAVLYERGMDPRPGGGPDAFGDWAYALRCRLAAGGSAVGACTRIDTGDGLAMYAPNKPHTLALGLISHAIDPAGELCAPSRRMLDELFAGLDPVANPFGPLADFADAAGGWWKGASQAAQMLVFAIDGYARCTGP